MVELTNNEVIDYISNFLSGNGDAWDWDDFTSIRIEDEFLEEIRIECCKVQDKYPPNDKKGYCSEEGSEYLRHLIRKVKAKDKVRNDE